MQVASIYALFSIKPDLAGLQRTHSAIRQVRNSIMSIGAWMGGAAMLKGMVGFNARVEDTKNNIASMLALAGKTTVVSQLENANKLYEGLRKRAAELPGSTEDYVQAMSRLTFPIMTAGLGLKDLENMTVNAVVAAKGLGHGVKAAMTDIVQGIEGRYSTTDFFLKNLLEPMGYVGKEGRERFKGKSKADRARILNEALSQKAIVESAQRQADSFSGRLDKIKEQAAQFLGRIGLPLFNALGDAMKRANKWLEENKERVQSLADTIGGAFKTAFGAFVDVFEFLTSKTPEAEAVLYGLAGAAAYFGSRVLFAWAAVLGPVARIVGTISLVVYVFQKLRDEIGDVGAVLVTAFGVLMIARFTNFISTIKNVTRAMFGLKMMAAQTGTATAGAVVASAAGAAINGGALAAGGLGAAGAAATKGGLAGRAGSALAKGRGLLGFAGPIGIAALAAYEINEMTGGELFAPVPSAFWGKHATPAPAAEPPTPNMLSVKTEVNINVQGDMSESSLAEIRRVVQEESDAQLRHIQNAVSGGTK